MVPKKSAPQIHTVGRRKTATAKAYVKPGFGNILVNGRPYEVYFGRETLRMIVRQPLEAVSAGDKFDVMVSVRGGGSSGQAGAIRLGIARALLKHDEGVKQALRDAGLLTSDSRQVERKKYGHHKARKRPQFSKR